MNIKNKTTLFLILFFCFSSLSSAEFLVLPRGRHVPNGAVSITTQSGRIAQGFIVGDKLFSAAHVLQDNDIVHAFVTQDDRFIDISLDLIGQPQIHPGYLGTNKYIEELTDRRLAISEYEEAVKKSRMPFDIGYIQLKKKIKTDFVFMGESDPRKAISLINSLKPQYKESIVRITELGPIEIHESTEGAFVYALKVYKNSGVYIGVDVAETDLLGEFNIKSQPGDSGAALAYELHNGKFLVIGILGGIIERLEDPRGGLTRQNPTLFSAWTVVSRWLQPTNNELFYSLSQGRACDKQLLGLP